MSGAPAALLADAFVLVLKRMDLTCTTDPLNPCWANRKADVIGKHWGGGLACPQCHARALLHTAGVSPYQPVCGVLVTQAGEAHRYFCDASDLGLPPGVWPDSLDSNMGNGRPFVRRQVDEEGALYVQTFGVLRLRVFND